MNKRLKLLIIIAIVVVVIIGGGYIALQQIGGSPDDIILSSISIDSVADGTYQGEYSTTLVTARVEVRIEDSKIANIDVLEHDCGPGHSAEAITEDIVAAQSFEVDTVSGSTMSSKVILKAVELALQSGK